MHMVSVRINAKFKDTLFRMIFGGKKELLDLYNAINHSDYRNPDDLIVTTIGDVLYMGMKNDISFLISQYLNLYEAQSSWNPNMPLRGFFYLSRLYQAFVAEHEMDLFSEQLLKLPAPQFIVFYNGTKKQPDQIVTNVTDLLDSLIEQSVLMIGKPAALMNKEEKVAAIQFLNDAGAFLITKSGDKISKYFGISKFTLYSYIDVNSRKTDN